MANLHDTTTGPVGLDAQAMPPGAVRCWQVMTGLAIDNRADAIDYLSHAAPAVRLSTEALGRAAGGVSLATPYTSKEHIRQCRRAKATPRTQCQAAGAR